MKKSYIWAIDLGGTNTKFALVSNDFKIKKSWSLPTNSHLPPESVLNVWIETLKQHTGKEKISLIGIGSPGPLDTKRGLFTESPNLKNWIGFSFTKYLTKKLKAPCYIENDGNCAALGEWHRKKISDLMVITLGTGVGSGVINDNELVRGHRGLAVEAGHMMMDPNGPLCECGKHGCLEAYVGGHSMMELYRKENSAGVASVEELFDKAKNGDALAQRLVKKWVFILACGIGNLVNLFNPQKIILTGGVSLALKPYWTEFQKILMSQAFKESLKYSEITISKLQNGAGLLGAALWAKRQHGRSRKNLSQL